MARRRYGRRHSRHGFKIPVISLAILAGQAVAATNGDLMNRLDQFQSYYTGFEFHTNTFSAPRLVIGYGPWFAKGLIMKVARPLGAAPKLPFKGLPISLS